MPIVERVMFQGKYAVNSKFLDVTIQAEASLEPGETMEEAVTAIKDRVDRLAKAYNGQLDGQSEFPFTPLGKDDPRWATVSDLPAGKYPPPTFGVIDLNDEKIEIAIDNAETIESLISIKHSFPVMKTKQMALFNKKMSELQFEAVKIFHRRT